MKHPTISAVNIISVVAIVLSLSSLTILYDVKPQSPISVPEPKRPEQVARLVLLNGCGRAGLAVQFATALRERGYDVMNGQGNNADSFDFDVSVVVDRKGNRALAQKIADDLGISMVIDQYGADPYIMEDCEIILGKNWDKLSIAKEVHAE